MLGALIYKSKRGLPLAFILCVAHLTGCATLDESEWKDVSRAGVNANLSFSRLRNFVFIGRNQYYIPGEAPLSRFGSKVRCDDTRVSVRIAQGLHDEHFIQQVCVLAARTLDYVDAELGKSGLKVELDLIPEKTSHSKSATSISFAPKLVLGVAQYPSVDRTMHGLVTLIAHEGFHAVNFWFGREHLQHSEVAAYYFGLCAQLNVLARITAEDLPGVAVESLIASSIAGERVRQEAGRLLDENGQIVLGTAQAGEILARCALQTND